MSTSHVAVSRAVRLQCVAIGCDPKGRRGRCRELGIGQTQLCWVHTQAARNTTRQIRLQLIPGWVLRGGEVIRTEEAKS